MGSRLWAVIASAAVLLSAFASLGAQREGTADGDLGAPSAYGLGLKWAEPKAGPGTNIVAPRSIFRSAPQPMPSAVDNSAGLPPIGNQRNMGSCTAWAIGYYHATYIEGKERALDLNDPANQTSPAFLYNLANGGIDDGSYMEDVAGLLMSGGACSMAEFPYVNGDYDSWPSEDWMFTSGMSRKAASQNWIDLTAPGGIEDLRAYIAGGNTATIAIDCWDNFDYIEDYNNTYCSSERCGINRGGHVVCIYGYDDDRPTADGLGAFHLVNSWGTGWGDAGHWWMSYEAVLDPLISYQWALYMESEQNYTPSAVARVQLDCQNRGDITKYDGLRVSMAVNGSSVWNQTYLRALYEENDMGADYQNVPFGTGRISFDVTGAVGMMDLDGGSTFVLDLMNSGTYDCTLQSFEAIDSAHWCGNWSRDAPMVVPGGGLGAASANVRIGVFEHTPFYIDGNASLRGQAIGEFWDGDGTLDAPYDLHGYDINGSATGYCIQAMQTGGHVLVRGCALSGAIGVDNWPGDSGVAVCGGSNITVTNCTIAGNDYGLYFFVSSGNIVAGNNISGGSCSVVFECSSGNAVYHNNFLDSTYLPYDDGINEWDIGYPGTYSVENETTAAMPASYMAKSYGLEVGQDTIWGQTVPEDIVQMLAGANYTYEINSSNHQMFNISIAGYLDATDLDMGVFLDGSHGQPLDGAVQWQEILTANDLEFQIYNSTHAQGFYCICADADANEGITLLHPPDGRYFVKVLGFTVSGTPGHFDMSIENGTIPRAQLAHANVVAGSEALTVNERHRLVAYRNDENDHNAVYVMDGTEIEPWSFVLPYAPLSAPVALSYYFDEGTPEDPADDTWESFDNIGFVEGADYTIDYEAGAVVIYAFYGTLGEFIFANYSYATPILLSPAQYALTPSTGALAFSPPLTEYFYNLTASYAYTTDGGGNYWSDYAGSDMFSGPGQDIPGSDGFGDVPYDVEGENPDRYPLMSPWNGSSSPSAPSPFFRIPVVAGWNLISLPLLPLSSALPSVLADNDGDTSWDRAMWFDQADAANRWKQFSSGWDQALNDLPAIDCTMGVWVNVTAPGDGYINVSGETPGPTSMPLKAGWNLVGYPTLNATMTVAEALWGTGATIVEAFDAMAPYRTIVVGSTYAMRPGEGYWVYVPADTIWTVDW